jgi:hypothetical protein
MTLAGAYASAQRWEKEAEAAGLKLAQRHELPANNLLLVWERSVA